MLLALAKNKPQKLPPIAYSNSNGLALLVNGHNESDDFSNNTWKLTMPIVHVNQREPYLSHGAEVAFLFLINNESSAAFKWRITLERSGGGGGRRWRPKFEQQKRRR